VNNPGLPAPHVQAGEIPLFSVIWYGCNRLTSARQTIVAMQAQTCGDFELVVEDCGSTDGTLEFFRSAAAADPRISVFRSSKMTSGEALLGALRHCRGAYVAICPCDGHLLPEALEIAARELDRHADKGGICTTGFLIDGHGGTLDRVDVVTLLLTSYWPFLPAGFFRRAALLAVGIERDDWFFDSLPLELCCRLAADWGLVVCVDSLLLCGDPRQQDDGLARSAQSVIDNRLHLVAKAFSTDGFFAEDEAILELESRANQLTILWQQFRTLGQPEIEHLIQPLLRTVASDLATLLRTDHRVLRSLHRLLCVRGRGFGVLETFLQKILAATTCMRGRLPIHISYLVWSTHIHGTWLIKKIVQNPSPTSRFHRAAPSRDAMYADLYALAGDRHEARGQINLALEMWQHARPPDDINIDSLRCQAVLKSPAATNKILADFQTDWVRRHLGNCPVVALPRQAASRSKIRIGYFCEFMTSDTMRNMMRNVIAAHDRGKFEVFGYAPRSVPTDIENAFDVWRHTPAELDNREFVELLRADGIDVFVELTGFSPGNRFGAMALRGAPVQVSYLNHTGTSQVPNVDYVLSDEICTPSNSDAQRHYSEHIYRLPGCFFCFDYTTSSEPSVAESPHLKNGYITFGCFGSGGKIGRGLIRIWAELLHRVPSSILHIQNSQLSASDNRRFMLDCFRAFDIGAERLILKGGVDRRTLLNVYSRIDISLDTWPYCGGNTIAESLWHGVPVVTLRGQRFSSAYGASLVTAAGCAELVGETPDDYIEIAARLANDSPRLVGLRRNLRDMSVRHGLGDSRLHAYRLDRAYLDMLERCARPESL